MFKLTTAETIPLITVHNSAETFQGRKLFKGGNYMRKHGIQGLYKKGVQKRNFIATQAKTIQDIIVCR